MTQNLRLKGGKTLIPATSDVSDNYTLATSINGGTTDNAGDNTFSATTGGGADQSFYRTDTVGNSRQIVAMDLMRTSLRLLACLPIGLVAKNYRVQHTISICQDWY